MSYKKIDETDIKNLKKMICDERIYTGEDIKEDYSHDEMPIYGECYPEVVLEPVSVKEISAIMKYAYENNIPVTPRGAGTGLCGGSVAIKGGIMISTVRMKDIIEIDEDDLYIICEPGLLLADLKKAVSEKGLMYPPDPGEKGASIGGNVMTNAGGMRAVKYGVTRDYVRGMEVVLPNGDVIDLGGRIEKTSSGYSLIDLFIGSEGTLGIVTKLVLKLIPAPEYTASLLIPFEDIKSCIGIVPGLLKLKCRPTAIEYMQKEVISVAEWFSKKKFPHNSNDAYLLLMFDAGSQNELESLYMEAAEYCLANGASDVMIADTEVNLEAVWGIRDVFLEAIKASTTQMDECDVVVPVKNIPEFIQYITELALSYSLRILSFGHAGDGNIHVYICKDDLIDDVWKTKLDIVMSKMYDKAQILQGQISGEHGIGHAKTRYLENSLGQRQMELMGAIKKVFDPKQILNPGKVYSKL